MQTSNDNFAAPSQSKPQGTGRKTSRKARISLSCGPCRSRKLKCNRQQPCQNCIVRKECSGCIYTSSENRGPSTLSRIDRLENLVTSLMSQKKGKRELGPYSSDILLQDKNQDQNTTSSVVDAAGGKTNNCALEPDDFEADQLISIYQDEMANQSPFVIIPPGTIASDLRRDLPLLFRAVIIATSSHHPSRQAFYEKQIVESVTDHLLMRSHRSLELLQSILLFVAWYKRNAMAAGQLNNLLQLAIALVTDLNLNRAPSWFDRSMLLVTPCSRDLNNGPKTMDERRALLGCFYLSSAAATSVQRLDSMRLTRQIEESCRALIEKAEYPTDLQLVYAVKAQNITDRIVQTIHTNDWDIPPPPKTPVRMHIKAFQSEIAIIRGSLPPLLRQNTYALMHLDFASIRLYEVALLDDPQNSTTNPIPTDPTHLENLYSLLLATKSFITTVLATPGATYLSLSYITWAQFTYAVLLLDRLTFFKSPSCPSWDIPFVRSVIDFSAVLDKFANSFEQARAEILSLMKPGEKGLKAEQEALYNKYLTKIQLVRTRFEHRVKFGLYETKSGHSAIRDWEQDKARPVNAFEGNNTNVEQRDAFTAASMTTDDIAGLGHGGIQLDPSLCNELNDDSFWLNCANWEDELELFNR